MHHQIKVTPAADGWSVQASGFDNEMLFHSGANAETAARKLAAKVAAAGETAEILIYLRGGELAGRFLCPATGG